MTTPRSSFNLTRTMPFIRNTVRRYRAAMLFYGILCFLFLPVQYALSMYHYHSTGALYTQPWYERLLSNLYGPAQCYNMVSIIFFTVIMLVMPMILSVAMYGYMHNRRSVDVYHSLPLTRQDLFLGTAAAALFILWVPQVISFALTAALSAFVPTASTSAVLTELLFWMASTLAIFAMTSFVSTQVGTQADHAIFALVFNGSLSGVSLVLYVIASEYLYGFAMSEQFFDRVYRLCPFSLMVGRMFLDRSSSYLAGNNFSAAVWFVVSIVLLVVAAALYARRKSEQAEVLGNMGPLQVYIRAVGTLIAGVCFGALFYVVFRPSRDAGMLVCIALGSLLSYYIGDIILTHSVRSPRAILPMGLATVAVVCVLCGGAIYDYFGYETRVPAAEDVVSVDISNVELRYTSQMSYKTGNYGTITLTDPESIATVIAAHSAQTTAKDNSPESGWLHLTYTLKNGKKLSRSYSGLSSDTRLAIEKLETNDEVLTKTAAVFRMDTVDSVRFENAYGTRSTTVELTDEQKQKLIAALQTDLLAQPQSELDNGATPVGVIEFDVPYDDGDERYDWTSTYTYLLTDSFTNTIALLRETNAAELISPAGNSIDTVGRIGLYLYGYTGTNAAYLVACYDDMPLSYLDDEYEVVPYCEITKEEYESLRGLTCYVPNVSENGSGPNVAAVLFFEGDSSTPCGWLLIRVDDLPEELLERAEEPYEAYFYIPYDEDESVDAEEEIIAYGEYTKES